MLASPRSRRPLAATATRAAVGLASLALIAACGGAAGPTPTGVGSSQPPGGSTPSSVPAISPGGGGGGATLADGAWTGGTAQAVVSGPISQTIGAPLFASTSMTIPGQTFLNYVATDGTSISVVIYPDDVALTVTTSTFVGGGGSTADAPCDASITRAEANVIEGRIVCTNAPVVTMAGASQVINIDATFSATR